jgi:hypothetical protein
MPNREIGYGVFADRPATTQFGIPLPPPPQVPNLLPKASMQFGIPPLPHLLPDLERQIKQVLCQLIQHMSVTLENQCEPSRAQHVFDQSTKDFIKLPPGVYQFIKSESYVLAPSSLSPFPENNQGRLIVRRKTYDKQNECWRPTEYYHTDVNENGEYLISLNRGGKIHVFPKYIDRKTTKSVKHELLSSKHWRSYNIQGGPEPRVHCLL